MLGYRDNEIPNDRAAMEALIFVEDVARVDDAIRRHFEDRQPFDCKFRMRHKDGRLIWCRGRGQAIWNDAGAVVRFSGATSDITEQKQAEVALEHLAHFDVLTQLPNRSLLADRMAMALAQARRSGDELAVALLDLDGFKPINDTFGHDTGDLILIEVAARLRAALREVDTVARLGGDEFVLVISGFADKAECQRTLTRILAALVKPYPAASTKVTLSGSIGVTFFPDDDADPDTLIRHADQAMYVAKQSGRNRFHVFDASMDRGVQERIEARNRVIAALAAGELLLHYQPKVDIRQGLVVGAEALLRWQHPERGMVAPGEFLPLIDDDDFMVRLSEWVIDTALAQMEHWRTQGLDLAISVNLPARHLQDEGFPAFLEAALARHPGAPADRFELEVLESAALEDVVGVSALMQRCRQLGVCFALDDFGTGYASLACLRRLPIEVLKIDQSFVRDMLNDPDDLSIVVGVIGLADAFRTKVVAEGVESIEHAVMLLHVGCNLAQGYGIARPMPAQSMPEWVGNWQPDAAMRSAAHCRLDRQDLVLVSVEVEHRRWVEAIESIVAADGDHPPEFPPMDTAVCRFGRWLHGEGKQRYDAMAAFQAIDPVHERMHATGRELLALCNAGHYDRARQVLQRLFEQRDELLLHLHALIEAVSHPSPEGRDSYSPR